MAHANESGKDSGTTRRDFLKASTVAASATVTGTLGISNSVYAAGSGKIRVGMIGCGGRNTGAAAQALTADSGARLVAMCDIFMDRVKGKRRILKEQKGNQVIVDDQAERAPVAADDACTAPFCILDREPRTQALCCIFRRARVRKIEGSASVDHAHAC